MTQTISSGVTSSGLTANSYNPIVVLSGGELVSTTVAIEGLLTLSSGAIADDIVVYGDGYYNVGHIAQPGGEVTGGGRASRTCLGLWN